MKRSLSLLILAALAVCLTACARSTVPAPQVTPLVQATDTWPQNEYTQGIPVPPGTVTQVQLSEQPPYCAILLDGVSDGQFDEYLNTLCEAGFSQVESASEQVDGALSIGTLYSNGSRHLSLAHSAQQLSLYLAG